MVVVPISGRENSVSGRGRFFLRVVLHVKVGVTIGSQIYMIRNPMFYFTALVPPIARARDVADRQQAVAPPTVTAATLTSYKSMRSLR